ncbi:S8 family peptidase [Jiangella gansuensis]|uniref:S8 family peptidase n=1 Tax=Jiangella gansuensis TaxID=281473 RepID=UPI00047D6F85|nr:S8/S53 family peptidase [Jiangella gansuensis]
MFDPRKRLAGEVRRLEINAEKRSRGRRFRLGVRWNDARDRVEYMYKHGELLCRGTDLDLVLAAFANTGLERPERVTSPLPSLRVLHVGDRDAAELADTLAATLGDGVLTPNHVLDAHAYVRLCPATEPLPWHGPVTDLPEPRGTGRAHVAVVDTGFSATVADDSAYARFSAVAPDSEPDDLVHVQDTTIIEPYGGHGTAATARLLAVTGAESTTVHVSSCAVGGAVDEVSVAQAVAAAARSGASVISLQAGAYTREAEPPVAFAALRDDVLTDHPDTVLVAAAGNNSTDDEFWPAAFDWVTGVGGLTTDGSARADWSNHGEWVDVYAVGDNVTVPYPNGSYEYLGSELSVEFTQGHAIWSGTSFATPVVAGMIARRMIEDDVDAPAARDAVLADAATAAVTGIGPRALPGQDG